MATAKFGRFTGSTFDFYKTHKNWGRDWHHIVQIHAPGSDGFWLLLYNRLDGVIKVIAVDPNGSVSEVRTTTGVHTGWDLMASHAYLSTAVMGPKTGVFCYDRTEGEAQFLTVDENGAVGKLKTLTGWRKTWDVAVAGDWGLGSGYADLLLYDRWNGEAKFFSSDGDGGIKEIRHHTGLARDWDIIVPGDFVLGYGYHELLFYRRVRADAKFFHVDDAGGLQELSRTKLHPYLDLIVPGKFTTEDGSDLFCFSRAKGRASLLHVSPETKVTEVWQDSGWRRTWWRAEAGWFQPGGDTPTDELLLYDNAVRLRLQVFRVTDDDGTRAPVMTADDMVTWVRKANEVYASAGVVIEYDKDTDFTDLASSAINQMHKDQDDARKERTQAAAQAYAEDFPDRVVVFVTFGPFTAEQEGGFSSGDAAYICISSWNVSDTTWYYIDGSTWSGPASYFFAHELGHYLGLHHPFRSPDYNKYPGDPKAAVEALIAKVAEPTLRDLDGDKAHVRDTPPDVGARYYTDQGLNPADPSEMVEVTGADGTVLRFSPDRHNIMNYLRCDEFCDITADQARRVREHLRSDARKSLVDG
ncbi:MAG: hypothetical protein ABR613_01715 [Actinomycetota bacterium]